MLLKRLILHKFKRFFLSGVEHFIYTPSSNISIIAWPNGMGKSSLLSQLNPLPADLKKDYRDGGYKLIEYTVNNDTYIISSGYVAKGKHSFIKNDTELNPGGTSVVQKQLVEEHFKLTPNMFNILLGTDNLTTMSPSTRKYWFTILSPIDYTFSISVWNNLRSRARDLLGSVKIQQEELAKKTTSLISKEELDRLNKHNKELEDNIFNLTQSLYKIENPGNQYTEDKVKLLYDSYDRVKYSIEELSKLEDINIDTASIKLGKYQATLDQINKDLDKKAKAIKTLEILGDKSNIEQLKLAIASTLEYKNKLASTLPANVVIGSYNNLSNTLLEFSNQINTYLTTLLEPSNREHLSKESLDSFKLKFETLKTEFDTDKGKYGLLKNTLADLERNSHEHMVTCPNCNHKFQYTVQDKIAKTKKDIEAIESTLKDRLVILKNLDVKIKHIANNLELLDRVLMLFSNSPLESFLAPVGKDNLESIPTILNNARVSLESLKELEIATKKHQELTEILKVKEEASKLAQELGIDSVVTLEAEINKLNDNKLDTIKHIENISKYLEYNTKLTNLTKDIEEFKQFKSKEFTYKLYTKLNNRILKNISNLKLELSIIQKKVSDSNADQAIINNIQNLISTNKTKLSVVSKMVTALSPEGGLIAKSINSFLNSFLSEMNNIINSVWSYNMELLPCEVDESNDLNYKFKVKVNHDETIEDVSKLSSSMQEIVNLAFKIVFIKYLGLQGFPLILDEFGRTMDPEHRVNAYDVIDRVLSHNFNQIVLVCHFESMYSRFANAEFVELREYPDTTTKE